jgi:hypothetical protein
MDVPAWMSGSIVEPRWVSLSMSAKTRAGTIFSRRS